MTIFFLTLALAVATPATVSKATPASTPPVLPPVIAKALPQKSKESSIDLPAPVGEEMKGITIPQYDADGTLRMKFSTETARKMDEHNVEMNDLKIEFFEKDGKDIVVTVPHALFNLETKLLIADTTTTLKREDFDMVGDSATFDTAKRFGTMKGHVHTEIRNGAPMNN